MITNDALIQKPRPPTLRDVMIYFNQKGMPDCEALSFFKFYEKQKWTTQNGIYMAKWKEFARRWIGTVVQNQPGLFNRHVH
jgi:hypothetical protein